MTDEQIKQAAFMRALYNVDGNKVFRWLKQARI